MRPHDLVMRYGGDQFVCVLPEAKLEQVRRRLKDVSAELGRSPCHGSITAGFAEMAERDSAMDLINRADQDLLARRQRGVAVCRGFPAPVLRQMRLPWTRTSSRRRGPMTPSSAC